jgi:hypothetical protein
MGNPPVAFAAIPRPSRLSARYPKICMVKFFSATSTYRIPFLLFLSSRWTLPFWPPVDLRILKRLIVIDYRTLQMAEKTSSVVNLELYCFLQALECNPQTILQWKHDLESKGIMVTLPVVQWKQTISSIRREESCLTTRLSQTGYIQNQPLQL